MPKQAGEFLHLLYIYIPVHVWFVLRDYMYERLQNTHRVERSVLNVSFTYVYSTRSDLQIYSASSERYKLSFEIS